MFPLTHRLKLKKGREDILKFTEQLATEVNQRLNECRVSSVDQRGELTHQHVTGFSPLPLLVSYGSHSWDFLFKYPCDFISLSLLLITPNSSSPPVSFRHPRTSKKDNRKQRI